VVGGTVVVASVVSGTVVSAAEVVVERDDRGVARGVVGQSGDGDAGTDRQQSDDEIGQPRVLHDAPRLNEQAR
jgi:hypothetical protein